MLLLKPDGGHIETCYRNPEQLTELAPSYLQESCLRVGGRNRYGGANFRLVYQPSRFQIAGGFEVNCYDGQGNFHHTEEREVLMPRYDLPDEFRYCYVLELWHPVEWLVAQGYERVEYSEAGKGLRVTEPAWPEGCYEGIEKGPGRPWIFPLNVSCHTIGKAIHFYQRGQLVATRERMRAKIARMEREKEESRQRMVEVAREAIPPFALMPHVGYGGGKHLGQN